MTFLVLIILGVMIVNIYKRYIPVSGVRNIYWFNHDLEIINIVDLRDYNVAYKNPILGSINIPVAYLKRHYTEIQNSSIHVVASDQLEKNMGIRFLRRKGIRVVGYTVTDNCKINLKEIQLP
ncbi:hypothetical protein [Bacillus sp. V33-4]|uniref:hypothetical protein n=1 Tax=Bacillus sp. V33-4 TaxID=2054169 RepID=UPI000C78F465|nr:hypothetical protein [Bacillus sp. V33-4]PLR83695.1 hypothetical protein CVD23_13775 [Bacillus sp. V33-4]